MSLELVVSPHDGLSAHPSTRALDAVSTVERECLAAETVVQPHTLPLGVVVNRHNGLAARSGKEMVVNQGRLCPDIRRALAGLAGRPL